MAQVRLLLFGPPGAGKTALLGALAQAGAAQTAVLHGKLAGDTGRLHALRAGTTESAEEVTAYPLRFEPEDAAPIEVTLLDCDGRLAQQYLTGERRLTPRDSVLARAMLDADTVIVTVDAAGGAETATQLATVRAFLTRLAETRGQRADVAELPVYLVLTKCDLLARPDDTFLRWLQRIEDAKRKLGERLADLLHVPAGHVAFGTIELHLWATAIRRPTLTDRADPSGDPYGVAELFRQCLPSAAAFDRRERRAGRRLELAVGSLGFLVALLVLVAALFSFTQPDTPLLRLEERVAVAVPDPETADARVRLRGDLPGRLKELKEIESAPAFERLPDKARAEVRHAQDEITEYLQTREAFRKLVKHPYQAKNETEFDRFERQARDFAMPPVYAQTWTDTSIAAQLTKMRDEYARVRSAVRDEVQWIDQQVAAGKKLDAEGNRIPAELAASAAAERAQGRRHAQAWIAEYLRYLDRPLVRLGGDHLLPGTLAFTYAELRKFTAVQKARSRWEHVRTDLRETYKYLSMRLAK